MLDFYIWKITRLCMANLLLIKWAGRRRWLRLATNLKWQLEIASSSYYGWKFIHIQVIAYIIVSCMYTYIWIHGVNCLHNVYKYLGIYFFHSIIFIIIYIRWMCAHKSLCIDMVNEVWCRRWQLLLQGLTPCELLN